MPPPPKRRRSEYWNPLPENYCRPSPHRPDRPLDMAGHGVQFASRRGPTSFEDTVTPTVGAEDLSSTANSPVQSRIESEDYRLMFPSEEEDSPQPADKAVDLQPVEEEDAPQPADEAVDHIEWENSLFARDGDAIVFSLPADENNHQAMPKILYTQRQPLQEREKDTVPTMNRRLRPEMSVLSPHTRTSLTIAGSKASV